MCDVCVANGPVHESMSDVVARTYAHLNRLLPKFANTVNS